MNGVAVGAIGAGSLFLYAALTNKTVLGSIRALVQGKSPATGAAGSNPVPIASDIASAAAAAAGSVALGAPPAGNTGASSPSAASNQALAKMLATSLGHADWTVGQQWADWVSLWNQESGWSIIAYNKSGASGIAQNINGYGPDYLQYNAQSQITWGIHYFEQRYPSGPSEAWAHEVANNWY